MGAQEQGVGVAQAWVGMGIRKASQKSKDLGMCKATRIDRYFGQQTGCSGSSLHP